MNLGLMQVKLLLGSTDGGINSFRLLCMTWKNKLILDLQTNSLSPHTSAFMDGVRFSFGLPAFCYWVSCIAFVYFARDAGADWIKTIAGSINDFRGHS